MEKKEALKIAIKAVRKYAQEHYGWDAKFNEEKKHEWDKLVECVNILKEMLEEQTLKKG